MKLLRLFGLASDRDKEQDKALAALAERIRVLEERPPGEAVDQAARNAVASAVGAIDAVSARVSAIEAEFAALDPLLPAP